MSLAGALVFAARSVAGVDDPFGPVDQDPDVVRDEACRLVAPDRVCSPPAPPRPGEPPPGWLEDLIQLLVLIVVIVAAVALIVLIIRAIAGWSGGTGRRRRRTRDGSVDVEEIDVVAIDRTREPVDWRREADDHRRAGRFRDALRCRYRALVGDLARFGLIDEIPGRTTGEERDQLRLVVPDAADDFDAAAGLFDDAWYGFLDVSDGDVDVMEQLERRVVAMCAERAPGVVADRAAGRVLADDAAVAALR
jgi:hypothetical protein